MQGFRRQVLPVATGGDVCGVLKRSSDGWMRPPVRGPNQAGGSEYSAASVLRVHLSCVSLRSNAACAASPRAAAAMEEATHTSRAALRPVTAAVVKISAGLDCEAVSSSLGSVVMPGSRAVSCRRLVVNARVNLSPRRLRRCCRFLRAPTEGPRKEPQHRHWPSPTPFCYHVYSACW